VAKRGFVIQSGSRVLSVLASELLIAGVLRRARPRAFPSESVRSHERWVAAPGLDPSVRTISSACCFLVRNRDGR